MTVIHGVLLVIGAVLALVAGCWGVLWIQRRAPTEDYDERQVSARGNAYRIGFWVGILYSLVVVTLGAFDGTGGDVHTLVMVGILLQIMVFHICCLLEHAALPLSRKAWVVMCVYFPFGTSNVINLYFAGITFQTTLSEISGSAWIDILCAVCFFSCGAMQMIQLYRDSREG